MTERSLGEESTKLRAAIIHENQLAKKLNTADRMSSNFSKFGPIGDILMLICYKIAAGPDIEKSNEALKSLLKDLS